jgi:hypothetical protein
MRQICEALRSEPVTFYFLCSLRPESPEQHLLTNIAEVPSAALRTGSSAARYKASVSNMSAKRFAQDDGFVVG